MFRFGSRIYFLWLQTLNRSVASTAAREPTAHRFTAVLILGHEVQHRAREIGVK
jgi:hypothetical protein